MDNSADILSELKEISPLLAGIEKINVYTVPQGYFENLYAQITDFVMDLEGEESASNKTTLQDVPEGYFDSLSTNILAKIKKLYPETSGDEIRRLSPALYALQSENVFAVPQGYFDSLAGDILSKVKPVVAKVVTMRPRRTWLKIAAAAVVTGIIAFSSLQLFYSPNNDNISQDKITASTIPGYVKEAFRIKSPEQLREGIAKLSDEEIIRYLEKNGNVMDNELLIKNTDVSELPTQADYLLDVNTLNIYLEKIEGTTKAD